MSFAWSVFAYAGWLALAASLLPSRALPRPAIVAVAAAAVGIPFAWFARGLLGDPAYVTGVFVWLVAGSRLGGRPYPAGAMSAGAAAAVLAVESALVISAVSAAPCDLYHGPGFDRPVWCGLVALGCAMFGARRPCAYTLAVPAAALLALTGAHESRNAWDWYFDPLLALWACGPAGSAVLAKVRRERAERNADEPA